MSDNARNLHTGHRARMREKFILYGRDVFHTHELLEMLLFHAVPQRNTNDTAKLLIDRFGGLDAVFTAGADELSLVKGVGPRVSEMLSAVGRLSLSEICAADISDLHAGTTAGKLFSGVFENKDACAAIILLGNKMNLIGQRSFYAKDFSHGCGTGPFVDAVIECRASAAVVAYRPSGFSGLEFENLLFGLPSALSGVGALLLECYRMTEGGFEIMQNGPDVKIRAGDVACADDKTRLAALLSPISDKASLLADRLINSFQNLIALSEGEIEKINEITGDLTTSVYIKLAFALASRRITDKLQVGKAYSDSEICEYFKALLFGLTDECVYMLSLDGRGRVLSSDRVGEGSVNASGVRERRILEIVKRRSARGVIVAHNHPGGVAEPSDGDRSAALALSELVYLSGARLLSQYIVAGGNAVKL